MAYKHNYHNELVQVIKLNIISTKLTESDTQKSKDRVEEMLIVQQKARRLLTQGNTAGGWSILHRGLECESFLMQHLPGAKYDEVTKTVYTE